jgi:hypothetical protein
MPPTGGPIDGKKKKRNKEETQRRKEARNAKYGM